MGTGAGLLFLAIAVRLVRRIGAARRGEPGAGRRSTPREPPATPARPWSAGERQPTPAHGAATEQQSQLLACSAVMAAGTVVSRLAASCAPRCSRRRSARACTPTSSPSPTPCPTCSTSCWPAASSTPSSCRSWCARWHDPDGGEAYTNRIITLAALFLGVVTVLLVVAAPQLMSLYLDDRFDHPDRTAHLASVVDFARYCLPQVFFYGMFVLVGQILNARGRFGPMMWAPIANNVISVVVLVVYLVAFGPAPTPSRRRRSPAARRLLLGLGSTLGIAAQLLILLPYLRARRLHVPPALRLPRHRPRAHPAARRVDGAVRGGQPDRLHGRGPAGLRRHAPTAATAPATRSTPRRSSS